MADPIDHLSTVGRIAEQLRDAGLSPVLVGGMALIVLGSRRVTHGFDFVVPPPDGRLSRMVDVMYEHGLELAARVDEHGNITATIDNRKAAAGRLRIDAPKSAYFFNADTGLRIDLLFDFPIAAAALLEHASRIRIRGHRFDIASEEDLLLLKTIARAERSAPADAEDIAFLEARRKRVRQVRAVQRPLSPLH